MALKTYDPRKFLISFAGIPLNEGLADGTFLEIEPTTPGFSSKVGVDGEVTRARSHDRRATAKVTLMQTSDANERLSDLYAADREAVNGAGVGGFEVRDMSGATVFASSKAYISDDPDVTLGAEAETREWTFELSDYRPTHRGSADE